MGYVDKCKKCYGSGRRWTAGIENLRRIKCKYCAGTGKVKPYRVAINLTEGHKLGWNLLSEFPRFGMPGHCEVCNVKLIGRKTSYCCAGHAHLKASRIWYSAPWQKRLIAVRDGCACKMCGEAFYSVLVEGGPLYPEIWKLELDHVRPLHAGGTEKPENCQLLCESCHDAKTLFDRKATFPPVEEA